MIQVYYFNNFLFTNIQTKEDSLTNKVYIESHRKILSNQLVAGKSKDGIREIREPSKILEPGALDADIKIHKISHMHP